MIIRPVESEEAVDARRLQQAVLRPDGPLPGDKPPPPAAVTLAAFDDHDLLGAVTIAPEPWPLPDAAELPAPHWHLRSLAVDPEARGKGVGGRLVDEAASLARQDGAASMWAEIRVAALPVYRRCGWVMVGDEWDKPGVGPHFHGWVRLS